MEIIQKLEGSMGGFSWEVALDQEALMRLKES
jgi:hypothetical protein